MLSDAGIWLGKQASVPLTADNDIVLTLPAGSQGDDVTMSVKYNGPVPAPVAKGAHIADLLIQMPGREPQTVPLVAAEDVEKLSAFGHFWAALKYTLSR